MLYRPPDGFYDQPFYYVFDAASLADGSLSYNQFVNMIPGIGDFVLRRIVGLDRVLQNANSAVPPAFPTTGQFQFRDGQGAYLAAGPVFVGTGGRGTQADNSSDLAIIPELLYKDNGSIKFNLLNILRATEDSQGGNPIYSSQLGFGGIRRQAGRSPLATDQTYKPRMFTYNSKVLITSEAFVPGTTTPTAPAVLITSVINYDYELYQLRITYRTLLEVAGAPDIGGVLAVYPNLSASIPPELLFLDIISPGTPLHPLTISVSGGTVTITLQTDGGGGDLSTVQQVVNLINSTPAASALMTAVVVSNGICGDTGGIAEPLLQAATNPNVAFTKLMLYDQDQSQVYSLPILDLYVNSQSYYANGAVVPPLFYKKDARIRLEITSLIGDTEAQGLYMSVDFIGRQRIPCL